MYQNKFDDLSQIESYEIENIFVIGIEAGYVWRLHEFSKVTVDKGFCDVVWWGGNDELSLN